MLSDEPLISIRTTYFLLDNINNYKTILFVGNVISSRDSSHIICAYIPLYLVYNLHNDFQIMVCMNAFVDIQFTHDGAAIYVVNVYTKTVEESLNTTCIDHVYGIK